jgi:hypothetical protein
MGDPPPPSRPSPPQNIQQLKGTIWTGVRDPARWIRNGQLEGRQFILQILMQGFGSVSGSGSALIWAAGSGYGSAYKFRIRIQEGKNDPKNWKKDRIFIFWSARCSLLRAEGFSCSLGLLYGGLGISKLQFLIKKIKIKFLVVNFFQF